MSPQENRLVLKEVFAIFPGSMSIQGLFHLLQHSSAFNCLK